jgi:hypothetical protein
MPVSGTSIAASTTISTVDSATQITLSANSTGAVSGGSLIFSDLTRITHINGSDTLSNSDAMMTIAKGAGAPVLFNARRYSQSAADPLARTGYGFAPDLIWVKQRNGAEGMAIFDIIRGKNNRLLAYNTSVNTTSDGPTSFDRDGFTTSDGGGTDAAANKHYIAYGWKAGGAPSGILAATGQTAFGSNSNYNGLTVGAGSIHNNATGVTRATSISQTVSQTSGFSITRFTGHNDGVVIPHNLGGTPEMIIIKDTQGADTYFVWHIGLSANVDKYLSLNTTTGESTGTGSNSVFNPTPSSTLISSGGQNGAGGETGRVYMCWAWKSIAGVSAFGSYTGSGDALTVTYTGSNTFTARLIMVKRKNASGQHWLMLDGFRNATYPWTITSYADDPTAEGVSAGAATTPTSTGFTFSSATTWDTINLDGGEYVYMAFA